MAVEKQSTNYGELEGLRNIVDETVIKQIMTYGFIDPMAIVEISYIRFSRQAGIDTATGRKIHNWAVGVVSGGVVDTGGGAFVGRDVRLDKGKSFVGRNRGSVRNDGVPGQAAENRDMVDGLDGLKSLVSPQLIETLKTELYDDAEAIRRDGERSVRRAVKMTDEEWRIINEWASGSGDAIESRGTGEAHIGGKLLVKRGGRFFSGDSD